MLELLRHRDFRLILAGQSLSMFGDWTLLLVFGIWGKSLTGSNAIAGLMIFAMAGPGLLGPLGGLLADRVRRRHLMVTLNVLSLPPPPTAPAHWRPSPRLRPATGHATGDHT